MEPWSFAVVMLWRALVVLLAFGALIEAKDKGPKVKKTELDFAITDLQYFENSETLIAHSNVDGAVRISTDGGEKWKEAKGIGGEQIRYVYLHPMDNKRAYAVSAGYNHFYTKDQGETWDQFDMLKDAMAPTPTPFSFHAGNSDKVILNTRSRPCLGVFCKYKSYYTTDGFKTVHELRENSKNCLWAKATPNLAKNVADRDDDLILCDVEPNEFSLFDEGNRIVKSDDFFKTEMTPKLDGRNEIQGIINLVAVKGYLLAAQKSLGTAELRLYVSDDGQQWDRAEFPSKVEEDAYTVLESTDYSIQVHVRGSGMFNTMGSIFSSNSNGTYFTENQDHVNGNLEGAVDFEKVQGIQGIYLVNTVENWDDVEQHLSVPKKLESKITFDDGRTFHDLNVVDEDGKETKDKLHLHSVTSLANSGRVFSSPAPGLVMGVGNTGNYLRDYKEGDLWVSDDAGLTWRFALKEAHKYEFGDQGSVLIAINDEESTKKMSYSLTHGRGEWKTFELDDKVRAMGLTTTPDSTSLKFVLVGYEEAGSNTRYVIYSIDFEGLHEGKCGSGDFEDWTARKDADGKPDCIMGHTQTYRRRKADVECFIDEEFKEPQMTTEDCKCSEKDFECEYNFVRNDAGDCMPTDSFKAADGQCTSGKDDEKFKAAAWRLIPGDTCNQKDGKSLDEKKEFACGDTKTSKPANGKIDVSAFEFTGRAFYQKVYLERTATSSGDDETVFVRTDMEEVFITRDQGKNWRKIEEFGKGPITGILPHAYNQDMVFFLTNTKTVYYSVNRGKTFESFEAPSAPGGPSEEVIPLSFHVKKHNWLIWVGGEDCESSSGRCHYNAHYSTDRGDHWQSLLHYCRRCEFIKREKWEDQDELVYCEQHRDEDPKGPIELVSSSDWFGSPPKEHFRDIVAFATMSDYIVVANKDGDSNLKLDASVDGQVFADAQFPKDFTAHHETHFTLLDSSTKAIFLYVADSTEDRFEYGQLMKSNSNGTSYVSLLKGVNQNGGGYVDFEKMAGLKGTALVNVVGNMGQGSRASKLLQSKITHNDGAAWSLIHDVGDRTGDKFECDPKREKDDCSLHLHGYTEREDARDTFGSPSAVGLMMAVGNVGPYLQGEDQADTFLTRDGGISWNRVRKGKYMWEYGDQGSVIGIVQEGGSSDTITYTLDEGGEWKDFKFSSEPIQITDLTTVPSDSSAAFIVWGITRKGKLTAIKVDFAGLRSRTCELKHDESNRLDEGDYELWTPKHPMQDNDCLFGHITTLHRKKPSADCWNDKAMAFTPVHTDISQNCTCTRQDFECDYNFALNTDNTCSLVPGTDSVDASAQCKADPKMEFYHETKGYRKIPMSTCDGGEDNRYWGDEKPCPGFEKEFEQKHGGLSGFGLFVVAVILPFAAASAVGYYVYTHWDGKFGRIRLGDTSSYSSLDADQPWIKYPVAAVSAVVAVVAAIPLLLSAAWRQLSTRFGGSRRYTTRESFARGRAAYAVVDQDEDELLGAAEDDF